MFHNGVAYIVVLSMPQSSGSGGEFLTKIKLDT